MVRLRNELPPPMGSSSRPPRRSVDGKGSSSEERHHQRGEQREADGDCLVAEELAGHALHEDDWEEDRNRCQGGRGHSPRYLGCSFDRGLRAFEPLGSAPVDGLEDHDGVVHQHADTEG